MTTHEQPKARKHPVAIQSEVDEQVTALENAINGLERKQAWFWQISSEEQ